VQEPKPLGPKLGVHAGDTRHVSARPVEAGDKSQLHRVTAAVEDNRNCRGRSFSRECRWRASHYGDEGHAAAHQVGRQFWQPAIVIVRPAEFDCRVATIDVASFAQPLAKAAT
jgi:hypothetical protein